MITTPKETAKEISKSVATNGAIPLLFMVFLNQYKYINIFSNQNCLSLVVNNKRFKYNSCTMSLNYNNWLIFTMDTFELRREQLKLAPRIVLRDNFTKINTIGGADWIQMGDKLISCVIVCEFPSLKLKEKKTFVLHNPLPYKPGFLAYRAMPAVIEAFNMLEEEPDLLIVRGGGILHPRKIGIASHIGLVLNQATFGITDKLPFGIVEDGKVMDRGEVLGFKIKTREHARPIYVSPGHKISLGTSLQLIKKTIIHPHKMPEPLHLANKILKKKVKEMK
jgi:deoxyribonuclease V